MPNEQIHDVFKDILRKQFNKSLPKSRQNMNCLYNHIHKIAKKFPKERILIHIRKLLKRFEGSYWEMEQELNIDLQFALISSRIYWYFPECPFFNFF